jgi:hypothetical protein
MRRLLLFIFITVLTGCSEALRYDIDIKCGKGSPYFEDNSLLNDDKTTVFLCWAPEYFEIKCKPETVQEIGDMRLCSTHDGKSVRVRLFSP